MRLLHLVMLGMRPIVSANGANNIACWRFVRNGTTAAEFDAALAGASPADLAMTVDLLERLDAGGDFRHAFTDDEFRAAIRRTVDG